MREIRANILLRHFFPFAFFSFLSLVSRSEGAEAFLTTTFGNGERCQHKNTLKTDGRKIHFDLSALPKDCQVVRALLRIPWGRRQEGSAVEIVPLGVPDARPLPLLPPDYLNFDASEPARWWTPDPGRNQGLQIVQNGNLDFPNAALEVSYYGPIAQPMPAVSGLQAIHQSGQTFLTWKEIEDPVGKDQPSFEEFESAVLASRQKKNLVYRIYRHDQPIRVETLGQAELVREVPEALSCWNLDAVANTEHPDQGAKTKRSTLRPGYNNVLSHLMTRYRIVEGGETLSRATGLAVFTADRPGKHYYAVTASEEGRESAAGLPAGSTLTAAVEETPSAFPAILYQRTVGAGSAAPELPEIDVYVNWLGPPYHHLPRPFELYRVRWKDLPTPDAGHRLPLFLTLGTYGSAASCLSSPGWHLARRHVAAAFTLGLAEGSLWQGFHECLGTYRSYEQGVVHNYPQRRVLAAAAWASQNEKFLIDPDRISIWGQTAAWALRHGDVFSAVMSDGHGNLTIGKEPQKHGWTWGPYPRASRNWLGIDPWEYMDLPKWIRDHPEVELPFWLCWPAYGSYPSHTIGDFGFMPWPEMLHAMTSTRRAFAACWSTNGPGPVGPLRKLVPRLRLHQSLPAFTLCSLDASPGDGDHADAEKWGGINLYQLWEPETLIDEPARWEITLYLREDCAWHEAETDLTPRRCQNFKARPGQIFLWTSAALNGNRILQEGKGEADRWGLVTLERIRLFKEKTRVAISLPP